MTNGSHSPSSETPRSSSRGFLTTLFAISFLDMLGVGIIIPILPALFYREGSVPYGGLTDPDHIRWTYCLILASYSFMMFFGAPILGALSDRYGRKRIIKISLIGQAIGYALFGVALHYESLTLIFLSRMIPGFFGGSLSVIFSSISDVSTPQDKSKNFALVGVAFALGFILGPFIGGILSSREIHPSFELATPFILATALALSNFVFVHYCMKETLAHPTLRPISIYQGFQNIHKAISNVRLRTLFSITFLNTLGFSFYTQFFSVYMYSKYHLSEHQVGYIFAWVGLWLIITQGFLVRKISSHFSADVILRYTMIVMGTGLLMMILPPTVHGILLLNVVIAVSQGLNSPNLLSLVSRSANSSEQGEILGINQSMQSFAQFLPPIVVGLFGQNLNHFPFIVSGSCIILAWIIFMTLYKPNAKVSE